MSAKIYSTSGPDGKNTSPQGTTVGGSKPLHRFIKGQPKIIGIVVLVLGMSFFTISIATMGDSSSRPIWIAIQPGFLLGTLFIICGILYILTEHNPTKKTVTISLALSIVTILGALWTMLYILPQVIHAHYYMHYDFLEDHITETDDEAWSSINEAMRAMLELIFLFYSFVGVIIFIVMSTLAGAALHTTKSQAIIVMTTAPPETPVE